MKKIIKIKIPFLFPSVNNMYGIGFTKKRIPYMFLKKSGKKYFNDVKEIAKKVYKGKILEGDIKVEAKYYFPDKRRRDVMNDKLTWDAFEDIIYKDDKQINEIHIYRYYEKGNGHSEFIIYN